MEGPRLLPPPAGLALPAAEVPVPQDAEGAARAFEALVVAELLRSARAAAQVLAPRETEHEDGWRDLAERQTAETLAAASPLGLARLLAKAAQDADARNALPPAPGSGGMARA